ncbi:MULTISPECIES: phosphotransferase family protein [unclassified Haladaptatus]|uniref:phosphotransferase family protein n=1 Tax=unclassified Haladaptatus TaxID=2622732 RepID=UPI0023E87451|nr:MULTISPECIES: phosphotransferase [unclassified Haladaptatus]
MTTATGNDSAEISDAAVQEMVENLKSDWEAESVERSPHGTDFVAKLDVKTSFERRVVVLKATTADFVDPVIARAEPRLLALVGLKTTIPVPEVFGYCDDHERFPAPFYLMEYVEGENFEGEASQLSFDARTQILREAGQNLAELHELGPLDGAGKVGVRDEELAVLDTDEHPRYDDLREKVLADSEGTLDSLAEGGFFPDLAEKPERFADLVPGVREYLRDAIPALSEPEAPTYCHWDYRLGNLLVDPETGATKAVLDWANLSAAEPAYNLAQTEFYLLHPEEDGPEQTATLRETFRTAYTEARSGWAFDEATRERMAVYSLTTRLGAMACLPLWYQDASSEERDERAAEHRTFVERYL